MGDDQQLINPQSDVKVPFYDYNFLKNYSSMYNLYLPVYYLNTFFKKLSHHLAVFDDEQDLKNGGYIFKASRPIFESFSVEITDDIEAKKRELNKARNVYPALLRRQRYDI